MSVHSEDVVVRLGQLDSLSVEHYTINKIQKLRSYKLLDRFQLLLRYSKIVIYPVTCPDFILVCGRSSADTADLPID